jgi:hypothetical protein
VDQEGTLLLQTLLDQLSQLLARIRAPCSHAHASGKGHPVNCGPCQGGQTVGLACSLSHGFHLQHTGNRQAGFYKISF